MATFLFCPTQLMLIHPISYESAKESLNEQLIEKNVKNKSINSIIKFKNNGLNWVYFNKVTSLAYSIEAKEKSKMIAGNYYVNAKNGKLISFERFICEVIENEKSPPNALGFAKTLYSGSQLFTTDANFNGGFRLREVRNGVNILTLNANFGSNNELIPNSSTDFFDNDNNWQIQEHNGNQQAQDVHWASEKFLDFFKIVKNRNGFDNNGIQARSFVHVNTTNDAGLNIPMENAYYYGGPFNAAATHSMYYGDGATLFKPLTSLDIVSHEMAHAIDEYTSLLIRNLQNEGQVLCEGFSDIWAATIENYWFPTGKQNWLIGEEIMKNGFSCTRSLRNPKTEGYRRNFTTEGNYPNTYGKTNWDPSDFDAHRNSTVFSHWYYILVVGKNSTNDLGNNYNVNGIGFQKAINIIYKVQTEYLYTNVDFKSMRDLTIQAARSLYGLYSCEEVEVTNAWYAVGVGSKFAVNSNLFNISGPSNFLNTMNYSLVSTFYVLPPNIPVTWSCNIACVSLVQFGNNVTVNSNGYNGLITLTAILNTGCIIMPITKQQIQINSSSHIPFSLQNISINIDCSSKKVQASLPLGRTITWVTSGGHLINGYPSPYITNYENTVIITNPTNNPGIVTASIQNGNCTQHSTNFLYTCETCFSWDDNNAHIISSPVTQSDWLIAAANPYYSAIRYEWFIQNNKIAETYTPYLQLNPWPCIGNPRDLLVVAVTDCSVSLPANAGEIWLDCMGNRNTISNNSNISISPNPTSNNLEINLIDINAKDLNIIKEIKYISITDYLGVVRVSKSFPKNTRQCYLQISNLLSGVYRVNISDGVFSENKTIIKK
jgi:Zn-dependent metalloprotease